MTRKNVLKTIFLVLTFLLQYFVIRSVVNRDVNLTSLVLWILSILIFYLGFPFQKKIETASDDGGKDPVGRTKVLAAVLIISFALGLRLFFMTDQSRFHYDEYLTAFFSNSLGSLTKLDWFAVYPAHGQWVSQFPLFFFLFQKAFLVLFGISTFSIRLSVTPYILITFISLSLIAKSLFGSRTSLLSLMILSFFSPDLYLTTLGLHFISSTAFFCLSFYLFLRLLRNGRRWEFGLFGFTLSLNYLTYYSSYLTLPLFFLFILILLLRREVKGQTIKNLSLSLGIFLLSLSPLIAYNVKVENFVFQRTDQVLLFSGKWSPYSQKNLTYNKQLEAIIDQTSLSIRSLYTNGIGGHGGYDFGHLALFESITAIILTASLIFSVFEVIVKKSFKHLTLLLIVTMSFFTGTVLTIPPPAFHRFSLSFPFIALGMANFLDTLLKPRRPGFIGRFVPKVALAAVLLTVSANNVDYFLKTMNIEKLDKGKTEYEFLKLDEELRNYDDKTIYISAFSSYALGKVLYIRFNGDRKFITEYPQVILGLIPDKPSLLIVHHPDEGHISLIKNRFEKMEIIKSFENHALLKIFP